MTPTYEHCKLWFNPVRLLKFWRKVDKRADGCWIWTGSLTDSGHGRYDFDGDSVRVHRLTWVMARERDIPDDMVIRHLMCENKPCCNPSHLVGGSYGENNQDRVLHATYDEATELEARAEYREHPYIGYFSEQVYSMRDFLPCPLRVTAESTVGITCTVATPFQCSPIAFHEIGSTSVPSL